MKDKIFELPLVALRGSVSFPDSEVNFDLSRLKSIEALENAMKNNNKLFLVSQIDVSAEDVDKNGLYTIGTVAVVKHTMRLPNGLIRVSAQGLEKAELLDIVKDNPFFAAKGRIIEEDNYLSDIEEEAIYDIITDTFEKYSSLSGRISPDFIMEVISAANTYYLVNLLGCKTALKYSDKQEILEVNSLKDKAKVLLKKLNHEIEVLNIQKDINFKVREKIDKGQRDYFLREQVKTIQNELGEKDSFALEIEEYEKKLKKINVSIEIKDKIKKEIDRLKRIPPSSSESVVSRDYIELVLDLPWGIKSRELKNISSSEKILDKEHYGLEEVKERIIEFLAVRQKTNGVDAPIICLVGPPGVGKTSIAKSVAKALNRKYVRMSLGGIRDEAEIRGHRKTYIGAMPGRIINAVRSCKTTNPLILLDEVDKISKDFRGDPSAALLEVLDAEQNFSFRDNYLEIPFDLSDVLFMCTANDISDVEPALKDRFEIIELSSYTEYEKFNIASKFLIPKQLKKHNLKKSELKIKDTAVKEIISFYTKEAGVRSLERQIEKICRKAVKMLMSEEMKSISVTKSNIEKFLGKRKYKNEVISNKNTVGCVCGLAWTNVGGTTLNVEVNTMKGTGKFNITGNIGKVMDESARAAVSYIRANCKKLSIEDDFYKETDIHIHIPEGAVPKDGPSAGITMTTAMISALKNTPVRCDVAMTGEITIRGSVLPIGGLKEKVLAAKKAGIKKIIIPADNRAELDELTDYAKEGLEFVLADNIDTVLENSLVF